MHQFKANDTKDLLQIIAIFVICQKKFRCEVFLEPNMTVTV